jgi:hypothetical protein
LVAHLFVSAVIVLEVYKDAKDKHWVRFLYNGEEMVVKAPAAAGDGQEGSEALEPLTQRYPVTVRVGEGERQEALALAPHAKWQDLALSAVPTDYEAECKKEDASVA